MTKGKCKLRFVLEPAAEEPLPEPEPEEDEDDPAEVAASPCLETDAPLFCFKCQGDTLSDCNYNEKAKLGKCGRGKVKLIFNFSDLNSSLNSIQNTDE